MAELTVVDANDRVIQQCTEFELREHGLITKTENGDETGFFPFGSFAYVGQTQRRGDQQATAKQRGDRQSTPQQPTQSQTGQQNRQ
ncbi:hypothetical protein [Halococcus saccharolyticus]|uniref:Uncharacterized protein n=1 Tax=Halococcus saccharolyticus DSM 5350 TaxID=1227455 RepID=M0MIE8_9EURY|nr:hypothetical protein [Halococcus saccharolyticus]EMA45482.1 hypothetical protein C449_07675 [Halococcus saccharolyticus DSM 5350]